MQRLILFKQRFWYQKSNKQIKFQPHSANVQTDDKILHTLPQSVLHLSPKLPLSKVSKQLRTVQGISCDCRLLTCRVFYGWHFTFIFQNLTTPSLVTFGICHCYEIKETSSEAVDYHMNFLVMFGVVLQLHCEESLMLVSTITCWNSFLVAEQVSWPLFTGFNVLVFMNKWGISLVNLCFIASIAAEHQIPFPIISRPY